MSVDMSGWEREKDDRGGQRDPALKVWPKDWYDARIVEAEDGVDTKTWDEEKDQPMGQMVVLKVKVYRRNEGETETNSVMDWILYHLSLIHI